LLSIANDKNLFDEICMATVASIVSHEFKNRDIKFFKKVQGSIFIKYYEQILE